MVWFSKKYFMHLLPYRFPQSAKTVFLTATVGLKLGTLFSKHYVWYWFPMCAIIIENSNDITLRIMDIYKWEICLLSNDGYIR